ncbi:conserved hypothetical protein [Shewanella sediminis HAW-EB3]|uniref:Uncharacterized protein n=1 Tax=Shewanella sediminis (strain HAW-EB3) TaxID=425104 RepID=A8FQS2_SHESH|nr:MULTISPECIES: hypothetical protein [Shewanella]ABV35195.1 conserved hypothetical protein [Shewanella sediminis HAW-EB3]
MSKGKSIRKEGKKQPQKTAKEKRMAKHAKKESRGLLDNVK